MKTKKETKKETKKKNRVRGFKSIAGGMFAGIIPVIVVAIAALTIISVTYGKKLIAEQTEQRLTATIEAQANNLSSQLLLATSVSENIANNISASYVTGTAKTFSLTMTQSLKSSSDLIYGCEVFFDNEKMNSLCAYRNNQAITTNNYSKEFKNEEFYRESGSKTSTFIMPPEYNEDASRMLIRVVTPLVDTSYRELGCTVALLDMDVLSGFVDGIHVGDGGSAVLISDTGRFLAGADADAVKAGKLISEDAQYSSVASDIMASESGNMIYSADGKRFYLYYKNIPGSSWKLILRIPEEQVTAPINRLSTILSLVGIVAIILSIGVILLKVRTLSVEIKRVNGFANVLAEGDFSTSEIAVKRKDELGQLGVALDRMFVSNKDILGKIAENAGKMDETGTMLLAATDDLTTQFDRIGSLMEIVNEDMSLASNATEEVNASAEEISASVTVLTAETVESLKMTEEIKQRASDIEKMSRAAYDNATNLAESFDRNLTESIENAKVVESIGELADAISNIAKQINLLSLNASIEAARAGEAGRGFAVVAEEIGHLASDTNSAASEINGTIDEVKKAFADLSHNATQLLVFIRDTVTPDYDSFIEVAKQYGKDAGTIEESSAKISEMADGIEKIMGEIANAVQNITTSTEETAESSSNVVNTIKEVSDIVSNVSDISKEQGEMAGNLKSVVDNFKL